MEASSLRRRGGRGWASGLLSSRRSTTLIAVGAAVLAGIVLFAFVQKYRKHAGAATTSPVLISTAFIPRGASADVIASSGMLQRTTVTSSQLKTDAITDPATLHGETAVTNVYPGEQLTAQDFSAGNVSITSDLTGTDRAVAVPIDAAHGLVGFVRAGDRVDVLGSFTGSGAARSGAVTPLAENVLVLNAPSGGSGIGSGSNSDVVLRVSDRVALTLAYAADNGKVWITLRPPVEAKQSVAGPAGSAH